ncbi:pyridoxal phosphate-dependent decarboxylase [Coniella lustricola]|uniref:Pyridoxal phosphate-dependent decarboxylase n=1 Tax=Coniella lustricola TaxID=2025994 RepID=A0A2T3AHL0_9PEZI|nr:pyridoxal phosphate-dependent decarboxylase [Coniella lustricola]
MGDMATPSSDPHETPLNRAEEASELIDAVKTLIIPFIKCADDNVPVRATGGSRNAASNALIQGDLLPPSTLYAHLSALLPTDQGTGKDGLLHAVADILRYSVNTWDQGFLDKLYSAPSPVGLVAELLLATLNTNLHVYSVSPALTAIEKHTARSLAGLFGFCGPYAGGVTCPGGSGSNLTSLIIARNHLYPETKTQGNAGHRFAVFTSQHGHYSVEKAAAVAGIGKDNVWTIPVDSAGRMDPVALATAITRARAQGSTPLYVSATAGTTVLGSYDPFSAIADVCKQERVWMHVDASWGGPIVFASSSSQRAKMAGAERADSLTVNPHKMMNVPLTCSFLLGPDMRLFHAANRTDAPYLFHSSPDDEEDNNDIWDLADLTLQCGRRGDALKLALAWVYHGTAGFTAQIDHAFAMAALLASELAQRNTVFTLLSEIPPPCLQVCFYYRYQDGKTDDNDGDDDHESGKANTRTTVDMVNRLRGRGFMVDYASFPKKFPQDAVSARVWKGSFFRVVVNVQTRRETILGLVRALEEVGNEVCGE